MKIRLSKGNFIFNNIHTCYMYNKKGDSMKKIFAVLVALSILMAQSGAFKISRVSAENAVDQRTNLEYQENSEDGLEYTYEENGKSIRLSRTLMTTRLLHQV